MLILGCGNIDRGDDAAGLLVVQRLRRAGIDAREHSGDALALLEAWAGQREVIVIDAVMSGAAPGHIIRWNVLAADLPEAAFRCSTHDLGIAEAVGLARVLGRLPEELTLYGIEGASFARGAPPSPCVMDAVERVTREIACLH